MVNGPLIASKYLGELDLSFSIIQDSYNLLLGFVMKLLRFLSARCERRTTTPGLNLGVPFPVPQTVVLRQCIQHLWYALPTQVASSVRLFR